MVVVCSNICGKICGTIILLKSQNRCCFQGPCPLRNPYTRWKTEVFFFFFFLEFTDKQPKKYW